MAHELLQEGMASMSPKDLVDGGKKKKKKSEVVTTITGKATYTSHTKNPLTKTWGVETKRADKD